LWVRIPSSAPDLSSHPPDAPEPRRVESEQRADATAIPETAVVPAAEKAVTDSRTLILYHAHCTDGFGAAWAAWKALDSRGEYVAVNHGEPAPEVRDRDVVLLDFAYPRAVTLELARAARSVLILDHHKSAAADLGDLPYCRFDMSKSGCVLAWEHFHPTTPVPEILRYVQDKDLWQWRLPESQEVSAALSSYPLEFRLFDAFKVSELVREGRAIRRYQGQLVREICSQARRGGFAGHEVPIVNTPVLQSYVGNALARGEKFVLAWHERPDGSLRVSLRSTDGGLDVAEIARRFGGGGHERAAGFSLPSIDSLRD
jgi:hypothetical protein